MLKNVRIKTRLFLSVLLLLGFMLSVILVVWQAQNAVSEDYLVLERLKNVEQQIRSTMLQQQQFIATKNRMYMENALTELESIGSAIPGIRRDTGRFQKPFEELSELEALVDRFEDVFNEYGSLQDQMTALDIQAGDLVNLFVAQTEVLLAANLEDAGNSAQMHRIADQFNGVMLRVIQDHYSAGSLQKEQVSYQARRLADLEHLIELGTEIRKQAESKALQISGFRVAQLAKRYQENLLKHEALQTNQEDVEKRINGLHAETEAWIKGLDAAVNERTRERTESNLRLIVIILILSLTGMGLLVRYLFTGLLTRLQGMVGATGRIAQGDYDIQISPFPQDEMGMLAASINTMAGELALKEASLVAYGHTLEAQVADRTRELQDALEMLRKTQATLVQSEKLAAVGQLVSGIAHEINVPLGTINSSVGNMSSTLEQLNATLSDSLKALDDEALALISRVLSVAGKDSMALSSREERQARDRLKQELVAVDSRLRDSAADILCDMGIYDRHVLDGVWVTEGTVRILEFTLKIVLLMKNVDTVRTAAARASGVVGALRNLGGNEDKGPMMPYDLTEGIDMALELFQNRIRRGIEVVRQMDAIPLIECNADEMNQVWINLISNALQAIPLEGVLTVEIHQVGDRVRVTIGDSGSGIADAIKDRIFEPFFTTRPAGEATGLGLDIVRRIIAKHHGSISFESVPGNTRFFVELPLEQG